MNSMLVAKEAIEKVFSETDVTMDTTRERLEELKEDINHLLEVLRHG